MSDINPSATTAAQDSRTSIRLEAGQTAPDFTLPSDNGDSVTLSALRGQNISPVLLPCRDDSRLHHRSLRLPRHTSRASPPADLPCSAYRRIRWTSSSDSASAII